MLCNSKRKKSWFQGCFNSTKYCQEWRREMRSCRGQQSKREESIFQARMNNTLEWSMERGKRSLCKGRVTDMVTIKVSLSWVRAV